MNWWALGPLLVFLMLMIGVIYAATPSTAKGVIPMDELSPLNDLDLLQAAMASIEQMAAQNRDTQDIDALDTTLLTIKRLAEDALKRQV